MIRKLNDISFVKGWLNEPMEAAELKGICDRWIGA